jgi:hypothetical protein
MRKIRMLAALCAVFLLAIYFSTVAYAGGFDETPEESAAPVTESAVSTEAGAKPFTPAGTGTVVDNTTDSGKQFYTIETVNGNIFFLIIDLERDSDNVYFLNAVTEKDLLALAVRDGDTGDSDSVSAIPDTPATPAPDPEPTPEPSPEPEQAESETGGNAGMMLLVVAVVLAGGGAGYYFKIYRPKQQQSEAEDDYNESAPYGEDAEDGSPPWYDEDERGGDGGE